MKTFIIVVETAFIAFICGAAYEHTLAAKKAENNAPDNNEATVE